MPAYYDRGKYRVKVVDQKLGENSKGNPEIQLVVQPLGIYAADGQVSTMHFPYTRTIFLVLTEGTIGTADQPGWVLLTLQYMGFNGKSFGDLDGSWKCVGNEYDAICAHEEYEGKEREKWSIHRPASAGQGVAHKPLEKKGLRALDAKFGKVLKAVVNNTPAKPTVDPNKIPAGITTTEQLEHYNQTGELPPPPANRQPEDIPF